MTIYTFKPSDVSTFVQWNDPSVWADGSVPDSADADVVFPTVTYVGSGGIYSSYVTIDTGQDFTTHSVDVQNNGLVVSGELSVGTSLHLGSGSHLDLRGSISAGSITADQDIYIQGTGNITTGTFDNQSSVAAVSGTLTLNVGSITNTGILSAGGGTLAVNVAPGGSSNFSGGTLNGGILDAYQNGTISLNTAPITVDAGTINLAGGTVTGQDPITGQAVALTSSLQSVAANGVLTLNNTSYQFGSFSVSGQLTLSANADPMIPSPIGSTSPSAAHLTASGLTVTPSGSLSGAGVVTAPIENNGTITAIANDRLLLSGSITGQGSLVVGPKVQIGTVYHQTAYYSATLELNGATTQNITFASDQGYLYLDQPTKFGGTIAPTGAGDRIVIANTALSSITGTSYTGDTSSGTLTLQQSGGNLSLHFAGNYQASDFVIAAGPQFLSSDPPSLLITVQGPVCFVAGTRILTPGGEVAVEMLCPGDRVTTYAGAVHEVVWIGTGTSIVSEHHPASRPVIIRAGALADGVPCRDLRVTEGHSLFLDNMLIPAASLINGRTILWDEAARSVTFFHVELAEHDVLVADGAPAESYRDDGNRRLFTGGIGTHELTKMPPYAPVRSHGPEVDIVWRRLVARAGGRLADLQPDPDIHLLVAGERHDPVHVWDGEYSFFVDGQPDSVEIISRAAVPALTGLARDNRRLGVALAWAKFSGPSLSATAAYDSPLWRSGFHDAGHGDRLRWTDGRATLPIPLRDYSGTVRIDLKVCCTTEYPNEIAAGHTCAIQLAAVG